MHMLCQVFQCMRLLRNKARCTLYSSQQLFGKATGQHVGRMLVYACLLASVLAARATGSILVAS